MKPQGPVVTLLAGVTTAAVLLGLSMTAASEDAAKRDAVASRPAIPPRWPGRPV